MIRSGDPSHSIHPYGCFYATEAGNAHILYFHPSTTVSIAFVLPLSLSWVYQKFYFHHYYSICPNSVTCGMFYDLVTRSKFKYKSFIYFTSGCEIPSAWVTRNIFFPIKNCCPPPIFCDVCRVEGGFCGHPQSGGGGHEYRVVGIFDDFVGFFLHTQAWHLLLGFQAWLGCYNL